MQTVNEPPASVLEKVRALLAKAESTEFVAEAEALTAKAQELMTRYRIEQAMLDAAGTGPRSRPTMMKITIADPYSDPKSLLLSAVARANGCTAVWQKFFRTASVFGFADDLAAVDALFTSLLVQSAVALHRAGPQRDDLGRSRTARFRRSFLIAFAVRVGERLREAVDATVEEMAGSTGTALVPILERRVAEVEAVANDAFPNTRRMTTRASDGDGWRAGTACADAADLGQGTRVGRGTAPGRHSLR
jgi:hypothetical protein